MPRRRGAPQTDEPALIPWEDSQPQLDVLDWHKRAKNYGLRPGLDDDSEQDEPNLFQADRLLANEEPEAEIRQKVDDDGDVEFSRAALFRDAPEDGLTGRDIDPIRSYLQQIGKTKLLTAQQEQTIGQQMEDARAELLAALAYVPCAVCCLVRLATRV